MLYKWREELWKKKQGCIIYKNKLNEFKNLINEKKNNKQKLEQL